MKTKICLVILLSSILFISYANAVNISLVNSIGVHKFSFDETKNVFVSKGSFPVENQESDTVKITLSVSNELSSSDMGPDGEPRKHSISNSVYFYPLENTDWLTFEDDTIIIPGNSRKMVNYSIEVPMNELPEYINKTTGFLAYININCERASTSGSGASVGINYNFKVFVTFSEDIKVPMPFYYTIAIGLIAITLIYGVIRLRLKERKKIKYL